MSLTSVRPAPPLGVGSDADRLLTVLLHRPGAEVAAISEADPARASTSTSS
jgi:arginine deiminase